MLAGLNVIHVGWDGKKYSLKKPSKICSMYYSLKCTKDNMKKRFRNRGFWSSSKRKGFDIKLKFYSYQSPFPREISWEGSEIV